MPWMTIEQAAEATGRSQASIRLEIATGRLRIDTRESRLNVFIATPSRPPSERTPRPVMPIGTFAATVRPARSLRRTAGIVGLIAVSAGAVSYFTIIRDAKKTPVFCMESPRARLAAQERRERAETVVPSDASRSDSISTVGFGLDEELVRAAMLAEEGGPIDVDWTLDSSTTREPAASSDGRNFSQVFANRAMAGDPISADDVP